ncbi:hypothetical protein CI109_106674 [Kwoniella shandongensis]|uniref:Uncharacterized protein n=1 Tax=Kwoniella shandongensis TaxID=1734106 RepID=A0A5M6BTA1_9TREE|nr:uncharacterized protein CI109_006412 [Kwoniella shandongensis]KAA5525242.1 hypothetical protein CI109_006412 [Kwoniella shandongensis]
MKPSTSKLHIPITEKSSPFFARPYPLSPIADNSPINTSSQSSSAIGADAQTPLLPPTPSMAEVGSGGYPFPRGRSDGGGLWNRARIALRKGVGMGGGHGNGVLRRVIWLGVLSALAILVLHQGSSGLALPERYSASSSSTSHPSLAGVKPSRPFRLPFSSSSSRPSSSIYDNYESSGKRRIDIASEPLPVEATLRERLDAWRDAPGGRGEIEGEVEHGGFVQWNLEQCSTIDEQHNTHMIQHSANMWASINRTLLHQYRTELIDHMENVLERGLAEKYGEGRGIVMVAGNADTLTRVRWSLEMLRSYESKLPVQIYHFPSERPDDDDPIRQQLSDLGAELVEAKGQAKDKGKNKSYHLKALAVVQCPWREVLYLDSDSIPTRDPEYMFLAPNYLRLGIFATPDYWKTSANNPIWSIMGVKCRNEWEMETGQMFIDKKLHLDVFLLIQYMLENHEFWFYFSDGDKDIFRWALLALRKRWAVPGRWVGAAALPSGTASGDFCSHTMLQHDSWGEPLFVHYNLLKQIPSGVGRGFSWGRTKQLPLFNIWPATPATARLGEPATKPADDEKRGLGDVDCDMLADAGEDGKARSEAKEMIMRRAARERGVKVKYHGGWISALCIDLDYIDPRPKSRQEEDAERRAKLEAERAAVEVEVEVEKNDNDDDEKDGIHPAHTQSQTTTRIEGQEEEVDVEEEWVGVIEPDWSQSPIEIAQWGDDPHLKEFEGKLYDLGFKPSGPGF